MLTNKRSKIIIVFTLLSVTALMVGVYIFYQKNAEIAEGVSVSDEEIWSTYEVPEYNFTFDYPEGSSIEENYDTSERFLRVQNYDSQVFSYSMYDRYFVEFFIFRLDGQASTCSEHIAHSSTKNIGEEILYIGNSVTDEMSGVGGLQAACVNLGNYDLYIQGQDGTEKNFFGRITDSLRFTD